MENNKKICSRCGKSHPITNYCRTKNFFFFDGYLPICNDCIVRLLSKYEDDWSITDKLCQYSDIPFIPAKWNEVFQQNKEYSFPFYNNIFLGKEYESLDWRQYYSAFKQLEAEGSISNELPRFKEKELLSLKMKWGANYQEEDLEYLENLYNGMIATQNINGALQIDQAIKLCKISLEIDNRIREGSEIDKILSSYDKLVKSAELTPKNVKNAGDFDSVGELYAYLEKTGWVNKYYDNAKKDVIDETIANIQNYNRRLWVNETGMSEDIEKRLAALQHAQELEELNTLEVEVDEEQYELDGITGLEQEFEVEV